MAFLQFKDLIREMAEARAYDPALLAAQTAQESAFNPGAVSPAGAVGLVQFMPKTWEWALAMRWIPAGAERTDPRLNLQAAVSFMRWLLDRYKGHASPLELALAAYNAGPGAVDKAVKATNRSDWEGVRPALPRETQDYVSRILRRVPYYRAIYGAAQAAVASLALLLLMTVTLVRRFA